MREEREESEESEGQGESWRDGARQTKVRSEKKSDILLKSKQNAKFFDFQDENRLIFVVLSSRFQNLF